MEVKLFLVILLALFYRSEALKCFDYVDSKNYDGKATMTEDKKTCQAWSAQSPQSHSNNKDELFPKDGSVAAAENYCRDPDGKGKPWCYTTDPATPWQYCDVPTCNEHCWVGTNSRSYFGIQSVTKNNHQCQLWTLQYPHVHTRNKDEQFPQDGSVYTAVNFCRDPDKKGKPWCYTREPNVPWEYCDVPIC